MFPEKLIEVPTINELLTEELALQALQKFQNSGINFETIDCYSYTLLSPEEAESSGLYSAEEGAWYVMDYIPQEDAQYIKVLPSPEVEGQYYMIDSASRYKLDREKNLEKILKNRRRRRARRQGEKMKVTDWIRPNKKYICLSPHWGCGYASGRFYIEMLKYFGWDTEIESEKPDCLSGNDLVYYLQEDGLWMSDPVSGQKPVLVPFRSLTYSERKRLLREKNKNENN